MYNSQSGNLNFTVSKDLRTIKCSQQDIHNKNIWNNISFLIYISKYSQSKGLIIA